MEKKKKIALITGGVILGVVLGSAIAYAVYASDEDPVKQLKDAVKKLELKHN